MERERTEGDAELHEEERLMRKSWKKRKRYVTFLSNTFFFVKNWHLRYP